MLRADLSQKKLDKSALLGTKDIKVHLGRECSRGGVGTKSFVDKHGEQILKPHKIVHDRKVKYTELPNAKSAKHFTPIKQPVVRTKPAKLALRPEDSKRPHFGTKRGTVVEPPLNVAYGTYLPRSQ